MTKLGRPPKLTGPHTRVGIRVSTPIWQRARMKGVRLGVSMNDVIGRLLRAWVNDEIETPAEMPAGVDDTDTE